MATLIPVRTAALVAALIAAGCASSGPHTRIDRDPAADLRSYKSFAFYEPAPGRGARYATLTTQRLRESTRAQLEKQGYVQVAPPQQPDLRVNVALQVDQKQELRSSPSGAAGPHGWRAWSGASQLETQNYRDGTLVVDLVDARRHALVWRGVAEGRVDAKAMQEPGAAIEAAVAELFEGFPNGRQGK